MVVQFTPQKTVVPHMVVSINGGYPQSWMVYFMENPHLQMDDSGLPPFMEPPYDSTTIDVRHRKKHTQFASEPLGPTPSDRPEGRAVPHGWLAWLDPLRFAKQSSNLTAKNGGTKRDLNINKCELK